MNKIKKITIGGRDAMILPRQYAVRLGGDMGLDAVIAPKEGDRFCGVWTPERYMRPPTVKSKFDGYVTCSVVQDGRVVREYPRQHNLFLNYGMDTFATSAGVALFTYAIAGTGTTVTEDDSGAITASQTGTTVTLSATGGAYEFTDTGTDAGNMIKWDTGEEARIVTVSAADTATVTPSQSVSAGEFTVYRTNQTAMSNETKRTNTYLTGAGNSGVTYSAGTITNFRTFDFSAEVGTVDYSEVGFSTTNVAQPTIRILLESTVQVLAGQQLRIEYEQNVAQSPYTSASVDPSVISGWAGATGDWQIQLYGMAYVLEATGATTETDTLGGSGNEAYITGYISFGASASSLQAWGSCDSWNTSGITNPVKATSLDAYAGFDFYRDKTATFAVGDGNSTAIKALLVHQTSSVAPNRSTFVYKFDSDQTKDALHTLTLVHRLTWSRTLA